WWYRLAEEDTPQGWAFYSQPGGRTPGAENRQHLPGDYYERQLPGKDPAWIKVYVDGDYGFVQDGKPVFPEYKDGLHCKEVELDPRLTVYVGIDFGLTPAAVFGQRSVTGQWRWLSELVCEDMGAQRFGQLLAAEMRSRYAGCQFEIYGDPAGDGRVQTDERTPFDILRAGGITARPAPSNDPVLRQEAIRAPLNRLVDGEPGLIMSPDCRVLRKAMAGAYRYRRLQVAGQERFHDVPEKNKFSHVADAAQYLMLGAGEGRSLIKLRIENQPRQSRAAEHNPFDSVVGRQMMAESYDPQAW
ncbi:MAG TPA: TerL, partial [Alphaproteobacteria bacterium]|nr:TerL [Alphaproteobacteria bacterium]